MKSINTTIISNLKFYKSKSIEKMSVKNIMLEIEGLIKNTVMSCASLYGFSAEEALAKIDTNGCLIKAVVDKEAKKAEKLKAKEAEKIQKEALVKQKKEAEKAEKLRLKEALVKQKEAEKAQKEAEKQQKEALVEQKKAEKLRLKEALVEQKQAEKLRLKESLEAERSSMKEEEILSKAAEKQALKEQKKALKEAEKALVKQQKEAEKPVKKTKKVVVTDEPCVVIPSKEDDDCFILFQNIPLMNEINSIRDVKKFKNWKKLSAGVKLARQILDI